MWIQVAHCALNKGICSSSVDLHDEAKLLKLSYRREQHLLNFMFDYSSDLSCLRKPSGYIVTRSHNKKLLKIKEPRTEKIKKSLAYNGP